MEIESESEQINFGLLEQKPQFLESFDKSITLSCPNQKKSGKKLKKQDLREQECTQLVELYQQNLNNKMQNIVKKKFEKLGKKILNTVLQKKKEEIAYFLNYVFLSVEKNHIPQLKEFNSFLFDYLKTQRTSNNITIHRYNGKSQISDILTAIAGEVQIIYKKNCDRIDQRDQNYSMIFLFDNVYNMDQSQLSLLAKFMDEEYSDEDYAQYQFYFVLPSSSNRLVVIQNPSLQYFRLDFCNSEKMVNNLLLDLIQDEQTPLFSKKIYKQISESYQDFSCSYFQNSCRLQSGFQDFVFQNLENKDVLACLKLIQEKINQMKKILPAKVGDIKINDYFQERQKLHLAMKCVRKLLKENCRNKKITQKLLTYVLQREKDKILVLLPEGEFFDNLTNIQTLGRDISKTIQEYFPEYKKLEIQSEKQEQNEQISAFSGGKPKKKKNREEILLGGGAGSSTSQKLFQAKKQLLEYVRDFIYEQISSRFYNITEIFSELCYLDNNNTTFNQLNNPDIFENILEYFNNNNDSTSIIFQIFYKFGREISLNYAYEQYKKIREEQMEDENSQETDEQTIRGELLNGIQELMQMGLVSEKQLGLRNVLEKHFFLKANYGFLRNLEQEEQ